MNEIGCYLKKIHNQLETGFTCTLKKYGLTSTQIDVLEYLTRNADANNTLSDLSAYFGVRHTSMIHVLKILEKKGFIIRKNTSTDIRSKTIGLTNSGREVVSSVKYMRPMLDQILLSGITEDEQKQLTKMLDQIYQNLNSDAFKELTNIKSYKH